MLSSLRKKSKKDQETDTKVNNGAIQQDVSEQNLQTETSSETPKKRKGAIIEFIQSLTIAIALSICLLAIITPSEVQGSSMEPNFHNGERVYTDRLPQWFSNTFVGNILGLNYDRGDVVVLSIPGTNISLIKRIVGMPGDKVEIKEGKVYLNDQLLKEDYLADDLKTNPGTFLQEGESRIIPDNSYFVAGDNRPKSNDSRYFGFVQKAWLQGKILARVWPLNKVGIILPGSYQLSADTRTN